MQLTGHLPHNMEVTCLPPPTSYTSPTFATPKGACCTHSHVIPEGELKMVPDRSYTPVAAPLDKYIAMLNALSLDRGVLVQLSVFGTDNSAMLDALGGHPDRLRGIAVLDASVSDAELERMHRLGVRGLRFNVILGGGVGLEAMQLLAPRLADIGWHAELLLDGTQILPELVPKLAALPCPVVLDHMANLSSELEFGHPAVDAMRDFARMPNGWVNISGAYRVSNDVHDRRLATRVRALFDAAPERIVWGSDWPHVGKSVMPDAGEFLNLLADWFPGERERNQILSANPARLYDFS